MAKKVRRVKKKKRRQSSPQTADDLLSNEAVETVDTPVKHSISASEQFRLDYAYVVKDLRRVLLLAGAMFALLIILNLLLQ
ncbi:MAG: hypothetical protein R3293_22355 [Candidatus Promineifilaceae bacterium]|nr:hypothetical protein [Candidatus Promineifilaceae bacterium]